MAQVRWEDTPLCEGGGAPLADCNGEKMLSGSLPDCLRSWLSALDMASDFMLLRPDFATLIG